MDDLSRSLLNTYSAQPLDRCSLERKKSTWLNNQCTNTSAEYLVLDDRSVVCSKCVPVILSHVQFIALNLTIKPILLGLKKTNKTPVFLLNINEPEQVLESISDSDELESLSLREITQDIDLDLAAMFSYATMLNHWHLSTRFCTRCGSKLEMKEGGTLQQCTNEFCSHVEYPRINSAVIMRVTKGDKILLARQEYWPEGMYSVLAGFVEVGETLEHAVAREVMEEVNIPVENINYHSSQPWPFPNSLMLGYTAEAISDELDFEQDDIEHAFWLTADELKEKMAEGILYPSSSVSISHSLINDWFIEQTGISIKEFKSNLA